MCPDATEETCEMKGMSRNKKKRKGKRKRNEKKKRTHKSNRQVHRSCSRYHHLVKENWWPNEATKKIPPPILYNPAAWWYAAPVRLYPWWSIIVGENCAAASANGLGICRARKRSKGPARNLHVPRSARARKRNVASPTIRAKLGSNGVVVRKVIPFIAHGRQVFITRVLSGCGNMSRLLIKGMLLVRLHDGLRIHGGLGSLESCSVTCF